MRTDSYVSSQWVDGSILTGVVADLTTLNSFLIPNSGWFLFAFGSCCDVAYAYNIDLVDVDGATVLRRYLVQLAAGTDREIWPSPIAFTAAQTVRVKLNGAVTTTKGIQVTIWPHFMAPGR